MHIVHSTYSGAAKETTKYLGSALEVEREDILPLASLTLANEEEAMAVGSILEDQLSSR